MARKHANIPLDVLLNGKLVGQFRQETSGAVDFRYHEDWLNWENAIPVSLSLPLREDRYIGAPVIAVFENLLPDNRPIRLRLAQRVGAKGIDAYSLLSVIGRDCVGALQFVPDGMTVDASEAIQARRVKDEEIAAILTDLTGSPLGLGNDADFRISIAGAQEKTALLYWKKAWHVPHGTTATTHILKPQIGVLPSGIDLSQSVENEHLCLELSRAFGLPVARSSIVDFADCRTLVVERFDRFWTKDKKRLLRVPQEDCCQALSVPVGSKYEVDRGPGIAEIMDLLKGSDEPGIDVKRFFKAQVVFWLLGATDGHAKNFSLRLAPGGRFTMTPLYDVLSAQPNFDAGQIVKNKMKLAMAVGASRHYVVDSVAPRHFMQTAKQCGLSDKIAKGILDEVAADALPAIEKTISALPEWFPQEMVESVSSGVKRRLKLFSYDYGQGDD